MKRLDFKALNAEIRLEQRKGRRFLRSMPVLTDRNQENSSTLVNDSTWNPYAPPAESKLDEKPINRHLRVAKHHAVLLASLSIEPIPLIGRLHARYIEKLCTIIRSDPSSDEAVDAALGMMVGNTRKCNAALEKLGLEKENRGFHYKRKFFYENRFFKALTITASLLVPIAAIEIFSQANINIFNAATEFLFIVGASFIGAFSVGVMQFNDQVSAGQKAVKQILQNNLE